MVGQAVIPGRIQVGTYLYQVCPEVIYGRGQGVQGYIYGRALDMSGVVRGVIRRRQAHQVRCLDPQHPVVTLHHGQLATPDTLPQGLPCMARLGRRRGQGKPAVRGLSGFVHGQTCPAWDGLASVRVGRAAMEGRRSALQAHEVRYVLPLGFLKSREELLREFRRAPAGAQLGHELDLHRNANSAAADMALNHPQLGFLFPHTLPRYFQSTTSAG